MAWLYLSILLVLAAALWGAYRLLGTPSRLAPTDYKLVLADVATSIERAAGDLRRALEAGDGELVEAARAARKIFQTGYYQTLRLRPSSGPDLMAGARAALGGVCEAYDWASRMLASESAGNPLVLEAARRLLDAGDLGLMRAAGELPPAPAVPRENTGP